VVIPIETMDTVIETHELNLWVRGEAIPHGYQHGHPRHRVTALIGPSGCGKSTLIRCFNRMNDLVDSCRIQGSILLDGREIYGPKTDVVDIRRRVGMVFQKPNPFPKSIYENVATAPGSTGSVTGQSWTGSWSGACGRLPSGTR